MKTATENISTEDTSQASFPPFTRGYDAIPNLLKIEAIGVVENLETLHSFSTSDIIAVLHSFQNTKDINLLVATPITSLEFIAGIRALRALISILDKKSNRLDTRKASFFIEIAPTEDAAKELLFAQFAQINTILCDENDIEILNLVLNHLPTPPIDSLFGNGDLEQITNRIIEAVYNRLFE